MRSRKYGRGWFALMGLIGGLSAFGGISAQTKPAAPAARPAPAAKPPAPAQPSPGAGPVIVVDTAKGTFEFETYPEEAPKSVEHILALVKRNFYNGHRVHRQEPGFVVQWGDPQSRDMTKRDMWGRSWGSGRTVGVAEFSKKRTHTRGAVGMAHNGDATQADSQIYVLLAARPNLDGKFAVIGRVISGMDVVDKLRVTDVVKKMSVK
ncbi:MAG: peptidylprolyl isomerase [Vicinamibacterales bacterium]